MQQETPVIFNRDDIEEMIKNYILFNLRVELGNYCDGYIDLVVKINGETVDSTNVRISN